MTGEQVEASLKHIFLVKIVETGTLRQCIAEVLLVLEVLPAWSAGWLLGEGRHQANASCAVVGACNVRVGGAEQPNPGNIERARHVEQARIHAHHQVTVQEKSRYIIEECIDR